MSLHHRILLTFIFIILSGYDSKLEAATLTLSWSDRSNNEDGFRIERMVSGGILAQVATVSANVTSYTDANLSSGLNYCYVVRAFNSAGTSDASNAACAVAMDSGSGGGTTQPGTDGGTTQPGTGGGTGNNSSGTITNLSNDPVDGRSTRGAVLTGDNVMIAGFIISGDAPKTMLIRARGPTLADLGVPHVMHDPFLRLYSGQTVIAQNDNWRDTQEQAISATGLDPCQPFQVGGTVPTDCGLESAVLATLNPGAYTAIVSGIAGETGVGLVEVYEVGNTSSRLVNMSTRVRVGTQDDVMIGGFIIEGTESKTLLLRARGPSLADFGVSGVLPDPVLQLYSGQTVIARNDDWQAVDPLCSTGGSPCGPISQIQSIGLDPCGAYQSGGAAPTGCSHESAMLVTLNPGPYTMIVSGSGGSAGVALLELFEVN
ncbi:MAG: hypothetical protein ACTHLX_15560 [Candidatus Binatia bacterium]